MIRWTTSSSIWRAAASPPAGDPAAVLKEVFGYDAFRPGQREIIEAVLAGNVAIRAGKRLEWDGPGMKASNAPEAEKFIRREYRPGHWAVPKGV